MFTAVDWFGSRERDHYVEGIEFAAFIFDRLMTMSTVPPQLRSHILHLTNSVDGN